MLLRRCGADTKLLSAIGYCSAGMQIALYLLHVVWAKSKELEVRHWHVGTAEVEGIPGGVSDRKRFLNCALYFHIESIRSPLNIYFNRSQVVALATIS